MKVTVIGGGVAGTTSAIALARIGAEVTLYEAYEDPAGTVGSFVSLASNGLRGLAVLGCLPAVQAAGFPVARQRMWSGRGKALGDVARARRPEDALHSVTLMRADLVAVLREEARRAGAAIVTGRRVEAAELTDGGPNGGPGGADLVVGADGIWSAARRVLDPAAPQPAYAGIYNVSGTAEGLDPDSPAGRPGTFNMTFGRRGAFIHLPAPDGTLWWAAQVAGPAPADVHSVGLDELAANYRTEPHVAAILRSAHEGTCATLTHVLGPVRRRHGDRLVLVGDAAHPVGAGQGASMAIEDSVALAHRLSAHGPVAGALAAFDQERRGRAGKLAKAAGANRDAKTAGPIAGRMRDVMMPLFFNRFYENATGWLYDYEPAPLGAPLQQAAPAQGL